RFISVLPGRYSLAQELRDRAWEEGRWGYRGPMSKAKDAAHYWTQTLQAEFAGRVYRFIVVRSSKLDNRKEKKLERVLETEQKDLAKLKKQLEKDRKSTRLNSSHVKISYAVFCLKKKRNI